MRDGAFSVQDLGAQLAAPLLRLAPGQRVLDACAAPGGKTTHIAELADVELRRARQRRSAARARAARTSSACTSPARASVCSTGDAGDPRSGGTGVPSIASSSTCPCTASGVVRRHPDVKWLRRESDIGNFARQQARLLDALWSCLARGGLLLYATCSVFADENEAQIAAFVARHPDALRESLTFAAEVAHRGAQLLPSLPGASHNQDGFFYALLRKP